MFGRAFFPWPEAVPVALHDAVAATVHAKLVGDAYVWNWESRVLGQGDPAKVTASFKQSTFWSGYFAPARLRRRASDHVPTLNEDGVIDRLILDLVDGQTPSEQIARRLSIRFPARFPAWEDAISAIRSSPSPASTAPTISRWAPRGVGSESGADMPESGCVTSPPGSDPAPRA